MFHFINLWLFCFAIWLLLSGFYDNPLLLSFGVLSCTLCVFLAWRAEVLDPEEKPLRLGVSAQIFIYWPWLLVEIIKSNIEVTRIILNPDLPISPTMISVKPTQRTDLGRVIYANSITLTPGTVTTHMQGETFDVHALTQEAADAVLEGDMGRRVSQLETKS
ncbi:MAG: Na+/H+ antiporter subunit E [Candidatus Competibacteraceae bacterium]|nr:Na+/H+ antiporter subunit E [Candidatus Competibacteraceae bacterium]